MNARDPNAVIPPADRDLSAMHITPPVAGVSHVYLAIRDVQAEIAKTGIAKLRTNRDQNYAFRGIDDLYNELCGIMAHAHLVALPFVVDHKQQMGKTASGKPMMMTTVKTEWLLVSAKDGTHTKACTVGEGFDMSDKSSNKAQSSAHKYALIQIFNIPVVGNDDGDNDDNKIGDKDKTEPPKGGKGADPKAGAQGPKADAGKPSLIPEPTGVDPAITVAAMVKTIKQSATEERLRAGFAKYQESIKLWKTYSPKQRKNWLDEITTAKDERKKELAAPSEPPKQTEQPKPEGKS